jgi:hypothetical protein
VEREGRKREIDRHGEGWMEGGLDAERERERRERDGETCITLRLEMRQR